MAKTYKVIINKIQNEEIQKKLAVALAKLTKKQPKLMYALVKKAPVVLFKSISEEKSKFLKKKFGKALKIVENEPEEPSIEETPPPPAIEEEESADIGGILSGLEMKDQEEEEIPEEPEESEEPDLGVLGIEMEPEPPEEEEEVEEDVPDLGLGIGLESVPEEPESGEIPDLGGLGLELESDGPIVEEEEEVEGDLGMPGGVVPSFELKEEEPEEKSEEEVRDEEKTLICPNCDAPNFEGTKYCDLCGFDLTKIRRREVKEGTEEEVIAEEPKRPPRKKKKNPILAFLQTILLLGILGAVAYVGYFIGYQEYYLMKGITYVTKDYPDLRARRPRLSPDATKIAYIGIDNGAYSVWIKELENTSETPLSLRFPIQKGRIEKIRWSPRGDKILLVTVEQIQVEEEFYDYNILRTINISQKSISKEPLAYNVFYADWGIDDNSIIYIDMSTENKKLAFYDLQTAETKQLKMRGNFESFRVIGQNQLLCVVDDRLVLVDIENFGKPSMTVIDDNVKTSMWTSSAEPKISPDKQKVLYTKSENLMVSQISAEPNTKQVARGLTETGRIKLDLFEPGTGADWLPDGDKIVYTDCVKQLGVEPDKFRIASISGAQYPFELKFKIDYMAEPHVIGNKLAFTGQRIKEGITDAERKGLYLENIFVVDLTEVQIMGQ